MVTGLLTVVTTLSGMVTGTPKASEGIVGGGGSTPYLVSTDISMVTHLQAW